MLVKLLSYPTRPYILAEVVGGLTDGTRGRRGWGGEAGLAAATQIKHTSAISGHTLGFMLVPYS